MAPSPFKLKVIVMIFLFLIVLLLLLDFHPRPLITDSFCSTHNMISNSSLTVKLFDGIISPASTNKSIETYIKGPFSRISLPLNETIVIEEAFTSLHLFTQYKSTHNTITTHSLVERNRRSNLFKQIFHKQRNQENWLRNHSSSIATHQILRNHSFSKSITTIPRNRARRKRRRRNVNINYHNKNIIDLDFDVANWRLNVNYGRHPIHKDLPLSTITFTPWTLFTTMLSFVSYLMTAEPSYLSKLLIAAQIVNGFSF